MQYSRVAHFQDYLQRLKSVPAAQLTPTQHKRLARSLQSSTGSLSGSRTQSLFVCQKLLPRSVSHEAIWQKIAQAPLNAAAATIQRRWRCTLARRRLVRLRLAREISLLPGIGAEYQSTLLSFGARAQK